MKKVVLILSVFFLGIVLFESCSKEKAIDSESGNPQVSEMMIKDADDSYNNSEVSEGDENNPFYVENDGLPEAYTIVETDMDDAGYKRGSVKKFFKCLLTLNLADTQIAAIRMGVRAFENCKFEDIRNHRDSLHRLLTRVDSLRKDLIDSFRSGALDRKDFQKGMKDLQKDFHAGMKGVRMKHSKHLRECYREFLAAVEDALTPRQWRAFVGCYR